MTSTDRRVVAAFLPAIVIHLGFIAAMGILFGLVDSERIDVLPVTLMSTPAPKITPDPKPTVARATIPTDKEIVRTKPKKRIKPTAPTAPIAAGSVADPAAAEVVEAESAIAAVAAVPAMVPTPAPVTVVEPEPPAEPVVDLKTSLAQIRSKIQKSLVYPPMAKIKGIEGTATIRFDVNGAGKPTNVKVVKSSGFEMLDQAAVKTVQAAAPFPLVDPTVKLPVVFELK